MWESKVQSVRFVVALALLHFALANPVGAASPANKGEIVFLQRCAACHSVDVEPAGVGPNLKAVVGRKAASTAFRYSPALMQSKLVWTAATLDRYLAAPTRLVPGTRMVIALPDTAQRAAVIKYLATMR
jgi:cytochrome c